MRVHEVELVRRVRFALRSATDTADFDDIAGTPSLVAIERTVRAVMKELRIPILPDGTIAVPEVSDPEIVRVAREIGRDWRDQGGVNAFLIDQLAEVTAPPAVKGVSHESD